MAGRQVDTLRMPAASRGYGPRAPRYLRSALAVARLRTRDEYAVVHFASGWVFRTDRLGALAVRALIDGRSDMSVAKPLDAIEAGAGARALQLIDSLDEMGAITLEPPDLAGRRWRLRRACALAIGLIWELACPAARLAPAFVLEQIFAGWAFTPFTRHIWRTTNFAVRHQLIAGGYADKPDRWLQRTSRVVASETARNYLFLYLSAIVPPARLARLLDRLFDCVSVDALARQLDAAGPVVGVFLHTSLCVALPSVLRTRGHALVRTVAGHSHGLNVSERSGRVGNFFGDRSELAIDVSDPLSTGSMLRHLAAGRGVYVALDKVAGGAKSTGVEMLGRSFARNDGPAWLAVRSGRPLALWTTHTSPAGVTVKASPFLHPDASLPLERRVADLSKRLYSYAEAAIREHPEAWVCWSYLDRVIGDKG